MEYFSDLVDDWVKFYMDEFTIHGNTFEEAKDNLEKVLASCVDTNLSLNHQKCHILMTKRVLLCHLIFLKGIQVDLKGSR